MAYQNEEELTVAGESKFLEAKKLPIESHSRRERFKRLRQEARISNSCEKEFKSQDMKQINFKIHNESVSPYKEFKYKDPLKKSITKTDYKMRETIHNGCFDQDYERSASLEKGICSVSDIVSLHKRSSLKRVLDSSPKIGNPIKLMYKSKKKKPLKGTNYNNTFDNINKIVQKNKVKLDLFNMKSLNYTLKTLAETKGGQRDNVFPISNNTRLLGKRQKSDIDKRKKFPLRKDLILSLQAGKTPERCRSLTKSCIQPQINTKMLRIKHMKARPSPEDPCSSTSLLLNSFSSQHHQSQPVQSLLQARSKSIPSHKKPLLNPILPSQVNPSFIITPNTKKPQNVAYQAKQKQHLEDAKGPKEYAPATLGKELTQSQMSYFQRTMKPLQSFHIHINKHPKSKG
ncbi:unnamed protein product [Moneuplotes crassus]|uniref:Uncharacterized protein n=1 Tax=Euplotes crassus TaxID=5936 RepID=A0AAD1UB65_EUPCR|nr:unnamed protein product [Moneuplotes crassus]